MTRHSDWCEEHGEISSHTKIPKGGYKTTLEPDYKRERRKRKEAIKNNPDGYITLKKENEKKP